MSISGTMMDRVKYIRNRLFFGRFDNIFSHNICSEYMFIQLKRYPCIGDVNGVVDVYAVFVVASDTTHVH